MSNTSATGGYLTPAGTPAPLEGSDLDAQFQKAVAGITGLPGQMVRPRWQPNPPKQPEPNVDWAAIGVTVIRPDANPYLSESGVGNGSMDFTRHEDIELLATFYGPNGQANAALLRDGFCIAQNVDALRVNHIAFVDAGEIRSVPELFNQQWVKRYDIAFRFRRQVLRNYAVLTITAAQINLIDDTGHVNDQIAVPPVAP